MWQQAQEEVTTRPRAGSIAALNTAFLKLPALQHFPGKRLKPQTRWRERVDFELLVDLVGGIVERSGKIGSTYVGRRLRSRSSAVSAR